MRGERHTKSGTRHPSKPSSSYSPVFMARRGRRFKVEASRFLFFKSFCKAPARKLYRFREDFMNDMHTLAEIRDVNIARIIAIVEEEPFSAIFEYGELGDLSSFLKSRDRDAPLR